MEALLNDLSLLCLFTEKKNLDCVQVLIFTASRLQITFL